MGRLTYETVTQELRRMKRGQVKSVGRAKLRAPEWVTEATKLESSSKVLSHCQILSQRTVWILAPEEAHLLILGQEWG